MTSAVKKFFSSIWSNTNYRSALLVFVVLVVWLLSGVFRDDSESEQSKGVGLVEEQTAFVVQVRQLTAEPFPITVELSGRSEANREVVLRSETFGRVTGVPVNEGDQVNTNETLCKLAVDDRQVRIEEAQAQVDATKLEYDGSLRLKSGGYQSQAAIAAAKAKWESAKANLLARTLDLQRTEIKSPFTGVLDRRPVEVGDYLKVGDECGLVLEMNPLKVIGRVSESQVGLIQLQDPVEVAFTSGVKAKGHVVFIESQADENLRTFAIEVTIANPDFALRGGMSATLKVWTREVLAHQIPANVLSLDDDGRMGVKILDSDNRVDFKLISIIGSGDDSIWVQGLERDITLISVGQEYVTNGQQVEAVQEVGLEQSTVVAP